MRNLVPDRGMVVLERKTTKTKTTREVYLPEELMNQTSVEGSHQNLQPSGFLFFNQSPTKTSQSTKSHLTVQSFDKELRRVCDWNGLSACPLTPSGGHN